MLTQIQQDVTTALKNGDSQRVSVLRMVVSELKNAEIDLKADGKELDEAECIKVLTKEAKKRKESIEVFEQNDRSELAEGEKAELAIIEEYLPEQMSEEDVEKAVKEVVDSMDNANFGQVMQAVMAKLKGQADGKVVSEKVKEALN